MAALGTLKAQDVHYTLFDMSPLSLNPALTGAYQGTARVGGNYRSQWSSFLAADFLSTNSFFIDAPIIRGFRKTDWVGVGMSTLTDQAGDTELKTSINGISASYHFALTKDAKTMLTLGLQGARVQRSLNFENVIFGDELQGELDGNPMLSEDKGVSTDKNFFDINAGLLLRTALDDQSSLDVGLAFAHITRPVYNFVEDNDDPDAEKRPMRITAHSTYRAQLTEKIGMAPSLLLQNSGGATEIVLQAWGNLLLKKEIPADKQPEVKLNMGLGYRLGDAAQVLFGMDYGPLRVAGGFDLNTSQLNNATKGGGGFEVAAWYVFKIYKKPNTDPSILCPHF